MTQPAASDVVPVCQPRYPARARWIAVARQAQAIRSDNVPAGLDLDDLEDGDAAARGRLMLNLRLRWPRSGVRLTVGFLDNPERALRERILHHMNLWNRTANVAFTETAAVADAEVRVSRTPGGGHWSWLGIDIQNHPGEPTMNLDGFTMATTDAELARVVCHEAGHTLGFPHEHLRAELIARLDPEATIRAYMSSQGWTRDDVIFQLLTPLEAADHRGSPRPDPHSIMCYQVPGSCTRDGQPIVGGTEIDAEDHAFAGRVYPKPGAR